MPANCLQNLLSCFETKRITYELLFGLSPPLLFYFAAFPLVAILTILPISFNGIGIREGGFIFFLGLKGISAEKALTLSLSFFAIQVVASQIGGLAYSFGFHKKLLEDYTQKI